MKAKLENDTEKPMYLIPPQTRPLSKGKFWVVHRQIGQRTYKSNDLYR